MAYNSTSSTYRTLNSAGSRGSFQQQQQQHIYEEQPYYSNERPITRQSISRDNRRTGAVCFFIYFFIKKLITNDLIF